MHAWLCLIIDKKMNIIDCAYASLVTQSIGVHIHPFILWQHKTQLQNKTDKQKKNSSRYTAGSFHFYWSRSQSSYALLKTRVSLTYCSNSFYCSSGTWRENFASNFALVTISVAKNFILAQKVISPEITWWIILCWKDTLKCCITRT